MRMSAFLLVPVSVGTSILLTIIVLSGIRRSNTVNIIIVSVTLIALGAFVLAGLPSLASNGTSRFTPFWAGVRHGQEAAALELFARVLELAMPEDSGAGDGPWAV